MQTTFRHPFFYLCILSLVVGLSLLYWPYDEQAILQNQLERTEENVANELLQLEKHAAPILQAAQADSVNFHLAQNSNPYPFVIYRNGQLIYWNNNSIVPEHKYLTGELDTKFLRLPEGLFIVKKWKVKDMLVVGLLELYRSTKITNQYISPYYNSNIFPFEPENILEPSITTGHNICTNDECYFQVILDQRTISSLTAKNDQWGSFLLLLSFGFLISLLIRFRKRLIKRYGFLNSLFLFSLIIIIPRLIMLWFNFPRRDIDHILFDATAFASSWLNPTLGDLLLNLLLLLVLIICFYGYRIYLIQKVENSRLRHFWMSFMLLLFFYASLLLYLLVQTIYHNSQISLDINQHLEFDSLRIIAYLSLVVGTIIAFMVGHIVLRSLNDIFIQKDRILLITIVMALFIAIAFVDNINLLLPVVITGAYIAISSSTRLYRSLFKIRFATYIYFFSWAVSASMIIAFATMNLEEEKEYKNQIKFAEKFLVENDALAEFLLHDLNQKIQDDIFIQSRLSSPYLGKVVIKDKIRQVYLSDYFDKYDVNIHLFDAQGRPFNPIDFMLRPIDVKLANEKYQTSYKNIYYIDEPGDELAGRYIDIIEIKKRGLRVGYILIDLRLKKHIPENVYPELLVDSRFLQSFVNKSYSYAVYKNNKIIYSSGRFNYASNLPKDIISDQEIYTDGIEEHGHQHIGVKDAEDNSYIVSVPAHMLEHFFSNFSFFFLLVVFAVMIVSLFYATSFLLRGNELFYSAKIQLYLSLAFFIPMLIVSVITLSLVSKSFTEEIIRENVEKAENIARNIAEDIVNEPYESQLINVLLRASRYANADANVFTPNGILLATSQPMIYENDLLAPYTNPLAIVNINYRKEQLFTADESVGDLSFKTSYHSIRSPETGNLIGILSVPFFQSEAALERHQIDIFTNVINVFTIIFLLFLLVSYLASEYLTIPLKIITRKLQKTSLEFNEPLTWEAKDEIGLMVNEYNRMVENLEESKKALAKTEKESAWREMAQQVAHEIKNPLTPMKLTLQHLQRTLSAAEGKDGLLKKSVNTLLQQVNILSEIAGSFSAFASMPSPSKEKFDLQELTLDSVGLFSNTEGIKLQVHTVEGPLFVEADKKLMGRIISNIIINAIEAGEGYQELKIDISLKVLPDDTLLLSIADNGPGIEESVREKIFMPHFSTKRRGSGIGLAIARRGIEHAGGKIWFETEERKGTTFFILLPLANE